MTTEILHKPDPILKWNLRQLYWDVLWYGILAGSTLAFQAVYAARLGASGFQIGLISAGPAVVNFDPDASIRQLDGSKIIDQGDLPIVNLATAGIPVPGSFTLVVPISSRANMGIDMDNPGDVDRGHGAGDLVQRHVRRSVATRVASACGWTKEYPVSHHHHISNFDKRANPGCSDIPIQLPDCFPDRGGRRCVEQLPSRKGP